MVSAARAPLQARSSKQPPLTACAQSSDWVCLSHFPTLIWRREVFYSSFYDGHHFHITGIQTEQTPNT